MVQGSVQGPGACFRAYGLILSQDVWLGLKYECYKKLSKKLLVFNVMIDENFWSGKLWQTKMILSNMKLHINVSALTPDSLVLSSLIING